jgi:hypothetical protein
VPAARRVVIDADTHPACVVGDVVDAIGRRPAKFWDNEVVHPYLVRVEDNSTVLIVGKLIYPGLISVNDVAKIQTTLFDASPATLSGTVVAARGQSQEDQWEVIVQYSNTAASAAGQTILPIGYSFGRRGISRPLSRQLTGELEPTRGSAK